MYYMYYVTRRTICDQYKSAIALGFENTQVEMPLARHGLKANQRFAQSKY